MDKYVDRSLLGATYATDVRRRQFNIDSRFRDPSSVSSSNFVWKHINGGEIRNMIRTRVISVEIPNVWSEFSTSRGNLKLKWKNEVLSPETCGCWKTLEISAGNYTDSELINAINAELPDGMAFSVNAEGKTVFESTSPSDLHFINTDASLGFWLGFRQVIYTGVSSLTSEALLNVAGDNYVLININDINTLECANGVTANAKVIVCVDKGAMQYNTGTNVLTEEGGTYIFTSGSMMNTTIAGGQFIRQLNIRLMDAYGRDIDLNGMDWSMTVEVVEAVNPLVYAEYRRYLVRNTTVI
jgi:hypothetical protein